MIKDNAILLTIDVEDWFQVENFKKYIPSSSWQDYDLRVEKNVHRILDLFDSIEAEGSQENTKEYRINRKQGKPEASIKDKKSNKIKATFFVLGWLAKRIPHLVREIHSRGHEVSSHGFSHSLCYDCTRNELIEDLSISKKMLEDITGAPVYGYRAPSFSINSDTIKIIEECGYLYDSSYNSFGMHGRYGRLDVKHYPRCGISIRLSDSFYELPISNLQFHIFNLKSSIYNPVLPWGGGGYFRLLPLPIFKRGVDYLLNKDKAYLFYLHPWEIDPGQPKVDEASFLYKFRHYRNIKYCEFKYSELIKSFSDSIFLTCFQYITGLKTVPL